LLGLKRKKERVWVRGRYRERLMRQMRREREKREGGIERERESRQRSVTKSLKQGERYKSERQNEDEKR
jgi:hypothetical protein